MERQLFVGMAEPIPSNLRPVKNSYPGWCKPRDGGLWTSTFIQGNYSGWVEWCLSEQFGNPEKGWILTPLASAKVYTIDGVSDLEDLLILYPLIKADLYPYRYLDFESISLNYDAIHLTEEGQVKTRFSSPINLYGWDCESTLWFRWAFKKNVEGPISIRKEVATCKN